MCLTPLSEGELILVLPYATFGKLWLESPLLLWKSLFLSSLTAEIFAKVPLQTWPCLTTMFLLLL